MAPALCSQPELLVPGLGEARCIDAQRLSDVAERPIPTRESGNRPGCRCALSRDIGAYDTCPHGCVYCYAVADRDRAVANFRARDPEAECLMPARKPVATAQTLAATLAASRS
jgi:DNA repair photolyase